ncbi:MAG TPA: 50S ribosomal protein L37e [Nanoarchaeota archaeon]|nr:50S ribosomal protein L37e [Candidatus Pacearchaeota archaeon]HIH17646.1 50S ribosomal protein L37e [Nanoarchaeota archaeon]HIH34385.1 50S ribosomal protein L37e [Nanoarchaeota archaeon]HIH51720.1 50S ribosomal protein L37e [Nanoarchaeota archaeon]HIH66709.1 50S ribosomal protein L37e [Nanoarchaeota archaeon]
MVKGTPTMGLRGRGKKLHIACRRCGHKAFHISRKVCAFCGFGKSTKLKKYAWAWKRRDKR